MSFKILNCLYLACSILNFPFIPCDILKVYHHTREIFLFSTWCQMMVFNILHINLSLFLSFNDKKCLKNTSKKAAWPSSTLHSSDIKSLTPEWKLLPCTDVGFMSISFRTCLYHMSPVSQDGSAYTLFPYKICFVFI